MLISTEVPHKKYMYFILKFTGYLNLSICREIIDLYNEKLNLLFNLSPKEKCL